MTLTVRLPESLDEALQSYCDRHGLTKSHVVQECLAEYLVMRQEGGAAAGRSVSGNFAALKRAGLIGCATGSGESATKDVVRRRVLAGSKGRR